MDIFFQDPNEIPLPPQEVHIRDLQASAFPDGQRVRVTLEVDPFQKRPSAELVIHGAGGDLLAAASVIESMTRKIELTLHLRFAGTAPAPGAVYTLSAVLYYQAPPEEPAAPGQAPQLLPPQVVDEKTITFQII
jgi:hypothetical protein